MGASFGGSSSKTKSNQQVDPWAPTIPALTDYLGSIRSTAGNVGATPGQTDAAASLMDTYAAGNPFAGQLGQLASDTLAGPQSQSGLVTSSWDTAKNALNPYVSGAYLDPSSNPYMQQMLDKVKADATQSVNAQFAGAGRDLSGINQKAVGTGVTNAELPLLFQQFNQQQQNQLAATNALTSGANSAATTAQGLDTNALTTRGTGAALADAANTATTWGPQNAFNLEQILKQLPQVDEANYASLLLPLAGLGSQGTGTSNTNSSSFGFGANLLSDERYKDEMEEIGMLKDGTPIYKFKYKGDDTPRMGVKAQDVEKSNPDAVNEVQVPGAPTDTVKFVDMDKAMAPSASMNEAANMAAGASPSASPFSMVPMDPNTGVGMGVSGAAIAAANAPKPGAPGSVPGAPGAVPGGGVPQGVGNPAQLMAMIQARMQGGPGGEGGGAPAGPAPTPGGPSAGGPAAMGAGPGLLSNLLNPQQMAA